MVMGGVPRAPARAYNPGPLPARTRRRTRVDPLKQRIDEAYRQLTGPGAPYELVERPLDGRPMRVFANAPCTLRELFAPAYAHADTEFLVYEGERWSFARLLGLADAIADRLVSACGIAPGERVAIAMRNYPEWLAAFIGIASTGAVVVPLNSWGTGEELEYALRDAGARLVFCDRQRLEALAPRLPDLGIEAVVARPGDAPLPPRARSLEAFAADGLGKPLPAVEIDPQALAMILYTSGTTGKPKGAMSTHFAIGQAITCFECSGIAAAMTNPEVMGQMMKDGFAPTAMLAVPLFHVSGLYSVFLLSLRGGRRIVMMYKWDAMRALQYVQDERVTMITGAPSMIQELLESPRYAEFDTRSLMSLGIGGSATPGKIAQMMIERLHNPFPGTGWGMTETNALGSSFTGNAFAHRRGSAGFVQPIVELRFLDEEGEEQPPGVPGHIWVRTPTLISGYWNRPDANAREFRDGWFDSGDIGYLDPDGYLYLSDRAKDMVIRGGENIYPLEVESTLLNRPDVLEAVAFGVPDERWGEELALVLRAAPGAALDAEDVRRWLGERLAAFKVPRYIELRSEPLPRNATQKVLKREVRGDFLKAHGRA
jgi:acyl-CoA synthetase (AMP-forming)/AMP-acid ligase II